MSAPMAESQAEKPVMLNMDGDEAAAAASYPFVDAAFVYPITPATTMCEYCDEWANKKKTNLWGQVPSIVQLQSEGGVAGAMHGAAMAGALTSTYTCSQGLLLMIPNMYKIAYEMTPCVIHVASRLVAHHAMCLYCDYSDVFACRDTGFALLCSADPQECLDLGTISHLVTCKARIPFLHFFDGLRTSHSIHKIQSIPERVLRTLVPDREITEWKEKIAMTPEHPTMRGCGQNSDIWWLCSERTAPFFRALPDQVAETMQAFGRLTGRQYSPVDYYGAPDAEDVILIMGSGANTAIETAMNLVAQGKKVGVLKMRLYRPYPTKYLLEKIPATCKRLCVLDRVKQVTASGEPVFLETLAAIYESPLRGRFEVLGGKFGVGGFEFNPMHVLAVFQNLWKADPMRRFCVGIDDDVSHMSLAIPAPITTVPRGTVQARFYGLGADGTVGSCKAAIALIGTNTPLYTQGYMVFDAKKTGGFTFCFLRFGPEKILSEYEIYQADYLACHHPSFLTKFDVSASLKDNGIFVLNSSWETMEELEHNIPTYLKRSLARRHCKFYNINAIRLARELRLGVHINMIMQACFFGLANILPLEQSLKLLKDSVVRMYSKKGKEIVQQNIDAIDRTLEMLKPVQYNEAVWASIPEDPAPRFNDAFLDNVVTPIMRQEAQNLPASAVSDISTGIFPSNTTRYEKRSVAAMVPEWDPTNCHECNMCAYVCPHAALRPFVVDSSEDAAPPSSFVTKKLLGIKTDPNSTHQYKFRMQVSPRDCLGCGQCIGECPVKALQMRPFGLGEDKEDQNWTYAMTLPRARLQTLFPMNTVRDTQFRQPLLEFHAACAGCAQPTHMKLVTQLLGPNIYVANAVGCSMIWGGYTPTSPYARNEEGHGPVYATSLFEDNAEFGYGMEIGMRDRRRNLALHIERLLGKPSAEVSPAMERALRTLLLNFEDMKESKKAADAVKQQLALLPEHGRALPPAHPLHSLVHNQDMLAAKSMWILGGDGWAYDIDFGGLDHVINSSEKVNVLIFDTEVYSNTGGQQSKATPRSVTAKLAAAGKNAPKKDLGLYAMSLGTCYVASCCMGFNKMQFIKAVLEAVAFPGPSVIITYCPCISHGLKEGLANSAAQQKLAVQSGYWPVYRFNPLLAAKGQNPLSVDYVPLSPPKPGTTLHDFISNELRFANMLSREPTEAAALEQRLLGDVEARNRRLQRMIDVYAPEAPPPALSVAAVAAAAAAGAPPRSASPAAMSLAGAGVARAASPAAAAAAARHTSPAPARK